MSESTTQPPIGLTDAEIEERRKAIGASDVAAILGCSPYTTAWTVWAEKRNLLSRWKGNAATRLGHRFEKPVLDEAEFRLRDTFRRNIRLKCEGYPIVSTLDAITSDGIPVEVKTTGLTGPVTGDWGRPDTDEIPEHYLCQVHTQLACCDAPFAYVFALIATRNVIRYRVDRSESLIATFKALLTEWWERHVVGGLEPDHTGVAHEDVKRLIRVPKKVVVMPEYAVNLVDVYQEETELAKAHRATAKSLRSEIELALKDETGYAEEGLLEDGRSVTFYETHKKNGSRYRVMRVKQSMRRRRR